MTQALTECLAVLGATGLQRVPGLLPAVLTGVSVRLESPLEPIRCVITEMRIRLLAAN
jgi:hypothetical protein